MADVYGEGRPSIHHQQRLSVANDISQEIITGQRNTVDTLFLPSSDIKERNTISAFSTSKKRKAPYNPNSEGLRGLSANQRS